MKKNSVELFAAFFAVTRPRLTAIPRLGHKLKWPVEFGFSSIVYLLDIVSDRMTQIDGSLVTSAVQCPPGH